MKKIISIAIIIAVFNLISIMLFAQKTKKASPGLLFSLDKIDTEIFYYGKLNDSVYYIKFDKVEDKYAEGFFFALNNNVYAQTHKFKIFEKRKSYILTFDEQKLEIKSDFIFTDKKIIGKYGVNKKFLKIFRNYKWSGYFEFKRHIHEEFITYPARYKDELFAVDILNDVYYGTAEGYWDSYITESSSYIKIIENGVLSSISKKNLDISMDIYTPANDTLKLRPLIMFIHGGGFYIGDKRTEGMLEWCKYFASHGYVCASINYRLGFKPMGPSVERAGFRALQDAHAAMRYLVRNHQEYGINPNMIFVGGSSAGAITALNLAFMRNENKPEATRKSFLYPDLGNIESSTNQIKDNFDVTAVINMWGAIHDLEILKNSKTAIISFHGDADKVVPIDYNYPFQDIKGNFSSIILNKMYGSLPIHIAAKELHLKEELHIFENAGHSLHVDVDENLNENFNFISKKVKDFLYTELIPKECNITSIPATPFPRAMPYYKTTCDNYRDIYWRIEGGIIINKKQNMLKVVWFRDATKHKLIVSGSYMNGARFYDKYEF
ncbi:MAG: alpha/beta hydrolase [Bacteroidales bacterium]|nr:alpha/beta hydrolase [Bacteroidales bacterium]